ncbi:hypothetical protein [Methylocystis sp. JR02]|uniref:hypothetical protein n=1 Tax=Methylocystis sp. JR02 TaxID=3046284 RepID=UPI0024BA7215|nr:hypothetical protein [Methylocystis sp. JR02]MDJ0450741.1 hypothetical protein [Methylocystis sp. JR02]
MKTGPVAASLGALVFGAVGGVALRVVAEAGRNARKSDIAVHPARLTHSSAALLAVSVLSDSALGHYRGSFENPGMFAPLISSTLALSAGADGAMNASAARCSFRRWSFALSVGVGVTGLGFHVYNVFRRPGGLTWLNLFYGAPLGAPAALAVSGLVGLAAERISEQKAREPTLLGFSAGRVLAAMSGLALAGTVMEAALFHFRGAFQNPFMWAPVTLPPVASALMAKATVERPALTHSFTRAWLWMTAALGFIGVGFHAYGVSRAMGGWRNWSQNLIDGPPLPAPPSFSALALTGLAALSLIETEANARDRQTA